MFRDCRRCGAHGRLHHRRWCDRCYADDKIRELLPDSVVAADPTLAAMRERFLAADERRRLGIEQLPETLGEAIELAAMGDATAELTGLPTAVQGDDPSAPVTTETTTTTSSTTSTTVAGAAPTTAGAPTTAPPAPANQTDALAVGDFHLKNVVTHALTGRARGTDDEMLELLAPYAGQRGRAVRLLLLAGHSAPKFGPRQRVLPMSRY